MNSLHFALLTTSYPEESDGSEAAGAFVADFAAELSRHVDVTVLAPGTSLDQRSREGLSIARYQVPKLPLSSLNPLMPSDWLRIATTLRAGKSALFHAYRARRIDYALAFWALPSGYWARALSTRCGVPYATWALGSDIWALGRMPGMRTVLRQILRSSHICYADGYGLASQVTRIARRNSVFLASCRKLPRSRMPGKTPAPPFKLAYLGRFHPNKGIDLLCDALGLLGDEDWKNILAVRIAGGGPLQDSLSSKVAELQRRGRHVRLEGFKNRQQATELLNWADFVLIPSRIESIPVIFSDAMQLGKPVLAMPVGDLPELIRRYGAGACAESVSPASFARLLTANQLQTVSETAAGCRQAAADFSVEATVHKFLIAALRRIDGTI